MISKYSLWNIAAFGGGGGDGGGRDTSGDRENLYSAPIGPGLESSPGYAETPKEYNSRGEPTATGSLQNATNEAELGQPPGLTSFTTAAFPGSIVPTGVFTGYPTSSGLSNEFLSGANSAQIAGQALDEMGGIPSPQMAADLAAMGGILAPGTPMPQARPENLGPEYSQVDFSENRSFPSFARELGTGQAMVSPGEAALAGMGPSSIMGYKTAEQAMNEAAQQQGRSGYDTLMAAASGQPSPLDNNIMAKILDSVVTPAKAEDNPPTITPLPGNVPLPPARPADLNQEAPTAAQTLASLANVPLPPARPEDMNEQLKASVVTPPAPSSLFETAVKSIVDEAPKNITNAAVGFVPGIGIVNTLSGLVGGPTVGGTLFPSTPATVANQTSTPYTQNYSGLTQDQFRAMPVESVEDPRLIAAYNNKIAEITGQPAPGPTNSVADMALGQRAPQVVDANGNVTLGGQFDNFIQDLFGPKFVGLGTPAYNAINNNAGYNSNPELNGQSMQPGYQPPPKSGGGGINTIPAVTNQMAFLAPTPVAAPITLTKPPFTLASNFGRTYVGAPINPLRYGYGPEATYYKTAAKGGMISPLNRMREVNGK